MRQQTRTRIYRGVATFVIAWMSVMSPVSVFASEAVDATGAPTGAPASTGAPACTGAGCGQGSGQGANQGSSQGGPSLQDLGGHVDENGNNVLPEGTQDTRQGASQGTSQGASQNSGVDISGTNSNTGSGSNNAVNADVSGSQKNTVSNTANDSTSAALTGNTGTNTQNKNTGSGATKTGDANIGVTQVKNDNTATLNGTSGVNVSGHNGNFNGDLTVGFGSSSGSLTGSDGSSRSIRAVNDTTGEGSHNDVNIATKTEEINEVQNDGTIENLLDLAAITGRNQANKNTGDGSIETGDANIAATLVNLLNTTVINGNLWLTVQDVFGDLNGNIIIPELAALAAAGSGQTVVDASNAGTGANSDNTIDVDIKEEEKTSIDNDANVKTEFNAEAITGQNTADKNTGGAQVATGDANVSASNVTLANTTVEGGNWALVIVNAMNRWLGYLVGDSGQVRALSQNETIREIEARNENTGADSQNHIDVDVEDNRETRVDNDADITNTVNALAVTGENEASANTGAGQISTGNANIKGTAVNIANTTVKDASLGIAVINIFGDWIGDLLYGGSSLLAASGSGGGQVEIAGENSNTGAESNNEVDVEVSRNHETRIDNNADIDTILNATVDTGNNKANANTNGATIETGNGTLALHARAAANLVGIGVDSALGLYVEGLNDTTGFDSRNKIKAKLNDDRLIDINNNANVSTIFAGLANTGDNEASRNTVGGSITTGSAGANVGIETLINRVVLALAQGSGFAAGDDIQIDADLINSLTGANSENSNDVVFDRDWLTNIANQGVVENLIQLLLNTGGNKSNENTDGGFIATGGGCIDGHLNNSLNSVSLGGVGGSLALDNDGTVTNDAAFSVTTGDNELNRNTAGQNAVQQDGCEEEELAQAPGENDKPDAEEEPEQEDADEELAEESSDEEDKEPRIAAAVHEADAPRGSGGHVLTRFPVAGDLSQAVWRDGGRKDNPWVLFMISSAVALGLAWEFDRRAKVAA